MKSVREYNYWSNYINLFEFLFQLLLTVDGSLITDAFDLIESFWSATILFLISSYINEMWICLLHISNL